MYFLIVPLSLPQSERGRSKETLTHEIAFTLHIWNICCSGHMLIKQTMETASQKLFKIAQNCSKLLKIAQNCSKLFSIRQPNYVQPCWSDSQHFTHVNRNNCSTMNNRAKNLMKLPTKNCSNVLTRSKNTMKIPIQICRHWIMNAGMHNFSSLGNFMIVRVLYCFACLLWSVVMFEAQ